MASSFPLPYDHPIEGAWFLYSLYSRVEYTRHIKTQLTAFSILSLYTDSRLIFASHQSNFARGLMKNPKNWQATHYSKQDRSAVIFHLTPVQTTPRLLHFVELKSIQTAFCSKWQLADLCTGNIEQWKENNHLITTADVDNCLHTKRLFNNLYFKSKWQCGDYQLNLTIHNPNWLIYDTGRARNYMVRSETIRFLMTPTGNLHKIKRSLFY